MHCALGRLRRPGERVHWPNARLIRLGYVNGDGFSDVGFVEIAHRNHAPADDGPLHVLLGGPRRRAVERAGELPVYAVVAGGGDFDGDGRHDLVGADDGGAIHLHLGQADGVSSRPHHSFKAPYPTPLALRVADMDRDGRPDVVGASLLPPSKAHGPKAFGPPQRVIWVALTREPLASTHVNHTMRWSWQSKAQRCASRDTLHLDVLFGSRDRSSTWLAAGTDDADCSEDQRSPLHLFHYAPSTGLKWISGGMRASSPVVGVDQVGDCNGDGWDDVLVREMVSDFPPTPFASLYFGTAAGVNFRTDGHLWYNDDPFDEGAPYPKQTSTAVRNCE